MPAQFWILRVIVGLMCVGFAFAWGRAVGAGRRPAPRGTGPTSWAVRTALTGAALLWRTGFDALAIGCYVLAIAAWSGGFYLARRPSEPEEDLIKQIFPDE